jgi:hypothetical protein
MKGKKHNNKGDKTMKTISNQSPKATEKLYNRAVEIGINAKIIEKSKPDFRRHHPCGSTFTPQKVIILNNIRMSLGQTKQYIAARERR